jgi:hypothetical protein
MGCPIKEKDARKHGNGRWFFLDRHDTKNFWMYFLEDNRSQMTSILGLAKGYLRFMLALKA